MWKYAGYAAPRSIVIPHLLTQRTKKGSFTIPPEQRRISSEEEQNLETSSRSLYLRFRGRKTPPIQGGELPTINTTLASFLKRSGIQFVRCWFQWNFFQKYLRHRELGPGLDLDDSYHFPLDDFVQKMNEAGITVIGVLGNGYSRFLPLDLQRVENLGEYLRRLSESSTAIVRHYKDRVKNWQIENEPNWWKAHYAGHWRRGSVWLDSDNQEPILRALYSVVRAESPDASIIINLEADSKTTDWRFYSKYCDVLGLDFYPNYKHPIPSDATMISDTAKLVKRSTGVPCFVIETGYPTGPKWLGYSEERQAKYIRSACEQAFTCDALSGLGWFRLSDTFWRSFPFHENYFGLLSKHGRPKLGWSEYLSQVRKAR